MSNTCQYSTFFADRLHFGIEVDRVQEALRPMPTTPVPRTTHVVDGLINLRGQIVLAIDLRARLELPPRVPDQPYVSLIVRATDGLLSLRVDALGDVLDRDRSEGNAVPLDPLPDTVKGPLQTLVKGVWKLERSLLLILDPDRLIEAECCLE